MPLTIKDTSPQNKLHDPTQQPLVSRHEVWTRESKRKQGQEKVISSDLVWSRVISLDTKDSYRCQHPLISCQDLALKHRIPSSLSWTSRLAQRAAVCLSQKSRDTFHHHMTPATVTWSSISADEDEDAINARQREHSTKFYIFNDFVRKTFT